MAKVRLFGLVLIITTFLLTMAAIVTRTSTIRVHSAAPLQLQNGLPYDPRLPNNQLPNNGLQPPGTNLESTAVQFTAIPVIVPLGFAGLLGIILWLTPHKSNTPRYTKKRFRRSKRKL
jgi:hypothetical protein